MERLGLHAVDNYGLNTMKKKTKTQSKKKVVKKKSSAKPKAKAKMRIKVRPKKVAKKKAASAKMAVKAEKPIGKVTHFFNHIKVAIVKFKLPVKLGTEVRLQGATTNFSTVIESMQYDHKPIKVAKKGQEVGIKLKKRVREGDMVYPI